MSTINQSKLSSEVKQKYQVLDNALWQVVKSDWQDRLTVEIGDVKQLDFKAQVKICRWGDDEETNEVNASFRLLDDEPKQLSTEGEKIKLIGAKKEVHLYELPESEELKEGGFEFEVILKEKPVSNKLEFSIETKGLDFLYQPELTEEETGVASETEMFVNKRLDFVLKENPTSVLDLGGGKGELIKELNSQGIRATNFDSSQEAYDNRVTEDFVQGDILNGLPFEDNSFDLITGFGFLKYIPSDKIDFVLKEIERVGKRGLFGVGFSDYQPSDSTPIVNINGRTFWLDKFSFAGSFKVKIFDLIKQKAFRPENIVGSYAVYHSTKQGDYSQLGLKNYRTGKAFHIYRPKIIDNGGNWVWGELNVNVENKKLSVTIPQEFLNKAVYPIRHATGLLFGYDTPGQTDFDLYNASARIWGSLFTSPADAATAISITFYCSYHYSDGLLKAILVLHSNLNILTNGVGNQVTASSAGVWYTSTFATSPTLSGSTEYVVAMIHSTYDNIKTKYDTGDADQGHLDSTNNYDTPTNPTDAAHDTKKYSIYCTYTAGGTAWEKDLSETVSIADSIIKAPAVILDETITIVDTIEKNIGKIFSEAITIIESLIKTPARIFTEIITIVETIEKKTSKIFSEAVTIVDTITSKITAKILTETITIVGTIIRQPARILSEVISLTDSFIHSVSRTLTEAVTITDSLIHSISKTLTEAITIVDNFIHSVSKTLSEAISVVDTLLKQVVIDRILTETITIVGSIVHSISRILSEAVTIADNFIHSMSRTLSEIITLVDTLLKQTVINKVLTEAISIADNFIHSINRTLTEVITIVDTLLKQTVISKILSETITIVDNLINQINKILSETITIVGSLIQSFSRTLTEAITVTGTVVKTIAKTFSESFSLIAVLWQRFKRAIPSWLKKTPTSASHTKQAPTHAEWTMKRGQAEN